MECLIWCNLGRPSLRLFYFPRTAFLMAVAMPMSNKVMLAPANNHLNSVKTAAIHANITGLLG